MKKYYEKLVSFIEKRLESEELNPHEESVLIGYLHRAKKAINPCFMCRYMENGKCSYPFKPHRRCGHYNRGLLSELECISGCVGFPLLEWANTNNTGLRKATFDDYYDFFVKFKVAGGCCKNVDSDLRGGAELERLFVAEKNVIIKPLHGANAFNIIVAEGIEVVVGGHCGVFYLDNPLCSSPVRNYNDVAERFYSPLSAPKEDIKKSFWQRIFG